MACPCENNIIFNRQNNLITEECDYTIEQIQLLKNKLVCLKNNNIFTHEIKVYNMLLGLFLSVLNTQNPCYLKKELNSINNYIIEIINSEEC